MIRPGDEHLLATMAATIQAGDMVRCAILESAGNFNVRLMTTQEAAHDAFILLDVVRSQVQAATAGAAEVRP